MKPRSLRAAVAAGALATLSASFAACDSSDDGEEVTKLTYTGHIVDALDGAPLAGVELCITSPSGIPCVTTDATGAYTIAELPARTRVTATVSKADYYPVAAAFITRDGDFTIDAVLLKKALVELAFTTAGVTLDTNKGAVLVRAYDPALGQTSAVAGLSGEISPAAGEGPFYNAAQSIPPDAEATSDSGTWSVVNLDAGTYQVRTSGTGRTCPGTFHWPGDKGAGWIETPVLAGHVTYVYVDCPAE